MPTGYTHAVQEGKITELRPFAMQCARAFGALIEMRDEPHDAPIPLWFEPRTDYYDEQIVDGNRRLEALAKMSADECETAAAADYEGRLNAWGDRSAERLLQRRRYEEMIAKVTAWNPPEAVNGLKDFMLEQLTTSISHDCDGKYDVEPSRLSGCEWLERELEEATRSVRYGTEHRASEIARVNDRNLWLDALRVSLA